MLYEMIVAYGGQHPESPEATDIVCNTELLLCQKKKKVALLLMKLLKCKREFANSFCNLNLPGRHIMYPVHTEQKDYIEY